MYAVSQARLVATGVAVPPGAFARRPHGAPSTAGRPGSRETQEEFALPGERLAAWRLRLVVRPYPVPGWHDPTNARVTVRGNRSPGHTGLPPGAAAIQWLAHGWQRHPQARDGTS